MNQETQTNSTEIPFITQEWTLPQDIKGFNSTNAPGITASDKSLYLAFKGQAATDRHSDHKINISRFEGKWGEAKIASYDAENFQTGKSPAVTVFNNRLFLVWKDYQEKNIMIAYSYEFGKEPDAYSFFEYKEMLSFETSKPPALAVGRDSQDKEWLYMVWKGGEEPDLRWARTNGSLDSKGKMIWIDAKKTGQSTDEGPSIAFLNGTLFLARKAHETHDIRIASMDEMGNWNDIANQPPYLSKQGPAIAEYNGSLYLACKSDGSNNVYYSESANGTDWPEKTTNIDQVFTDDHVAMTSSSRSLYLAYRAVNEDGQIKMCIYPSPKLQ